MRILLINNYDSYADLLAYTLWCVSGVRPKVVFNDAHTADALLAGKYDRIVLSPGPGHPAEPRDFGVCAEVIARCDVPLLGVCLGHQGIAMVHGGQLVLAPEVKHGKRSVITHNGHALFEGIPSPFMAMRYHSWVVDAAGLPEHVQVLARARDDGTIMALGLRGRPVVGVQFHPESVGTRWGRRLLRNFVRQGADSQRIDARGGASKPRAKEQGEGTETVASSEANAKTRALFETPPQTDPAGPQPDTSCPTDTARQRPHAPRRHTSTPRRVRFESLPWREPEEVFAHHYAHRPYAFWLDTAALSRGQRWSFMGAPHQVLEVPSERVLRAAESSGETKDISDDPWRAWRHALGERPEGLDDLPCPFAGGLVGYLGYEMQRYGADATQLSCAGGQSLGTARGSKNASQIDARKSQRESKMFTPSTLQSDGPAREPDSVMQVCRRFLAFDHLDRRVYAVTLQSDMASATTWLRAIQTDWRRVRPALPAIQTTGECAPGDHWPSHVQPRIGRPDYLRRIAEAQAHIQRGNIYEVCLTNRFDATCDVDPWYLYRILRHTHPAPYAAFLKSPTTSVLSASPERFLTLNAKGHVTTEPIKGTRAHVGTRGALAFQRRQLRHSAKDQAELLMVVDLLRNDIARVARRDSLIVSDLFRMTDHPTVVQMSAMIGAEMRRGRDAIDLLHACFPGGSITGAPKRRAMKIIGGLEAQSRGPYTGAIGYLSAGGAMDMNIAIRTIVQQKDKVSFGAGGAITAESNPQAECDEVDAKAFALARSIALATHGRCGHMRLEAKSFREDGHVFAAR